MAKSKNGGTRSLLRGRVGSDVYSIGKDAAGNKQQVVRSLAEQVANPQTIAQMRGRMIMSTVMQAVSGLVVIVDHSFDGVTAGQPSISEFIRKNYARIKSDVANHPASSNIFGLNQYQEKGIKQGAYLISEGRAAALAGATLNGATKQLVLTVSGSLTVGNLRTSLGIGVNDYFTAVAIATDGTAKYCRCHINAALADSTVISTSNLADVITFEGNVSASMAIAGQDIAITFSTFTTNCGLIVSRKTESGYAHNTVVLAAPTAPAYTAEVALPTYPVGTQRFLNGGDENVVAAAAADVVVNTGGSNTGGSNTGGSNTGGSNTGGSNTGGGNNGGGGGTDPNDPTAGADQN